MRLPDIENKQGLFILGTDTGVGKTVVTCLLAHQLRDQGLPVGVMKPYLSGNWEDARLLRRAAGLKESLKTISPAFFKKPLAPILNYSSNAESHRDWQKVCAGFQSLKKRYTPLLVEGIGGVLVPLGNQKTIADLAHEFHFPVWLVARPGLGTINHVLLSLEALKKRRVRVTRLVFSGYSGQDLAEKTNPILIKKLTALPLTLIPRLDKPSL